MRLKDIRYSVLWCVVLFKHKCAFTERASDDPATNSRTGMLLAVFTKDYWASLSEPFGNVLESFGDHSVICVIPTQDFRLEISLQISEYTGNSTE